MDASEVVKDLENRGLILSAEALDILIQSPNPEELARIAIKAIGDRVIIDPVDFAIKAKSKVALIEGEEKVSVERAIMFKPVAKEYDAQIKILNQDMIKSSGSVGSIEDFVDYFRDRYEETSKMLKGRGEHPFIEIKNLSKKRGSRVKVIGMISEKRDTKNGHVFIRLEDPTGVINALIPSSNAVLKRYSLTLVNDEVIAVEGRLSKDLFIVDSFFEPDIPLKSTRTIKEDLSIAMLSDIHIGSKLFMQKQFEQFISWLKGEVGNQKQRELASHVKYITVAGDICDGIGVYPGQENELEILDIYDQYDVLSKYIQEIPEYIHVIISPGDHDAVKRSDPQPPLPEQIVPDLYKLSNVNFVPNPATVELHGLNTLVYHGVGFIDLIFSSAELSFENAAKSMVQTLKKRHLHPIYGGKPITPEKQDPLVIRDVPDIYHTGETHYNSYELYKGTICVNSGTWQSRSLYQIRQGHGSTPCILPIVNMRRGKIEALHFEKGL